MLTRVNARQGIVEARLQPARAHLCRGSSPPRRVSLGETRRPTGDAEVCQTELDQDATMPRHALTRVRRPPRSFLQIIRPRLSNSWVISYGAHYPASRV
jgi:hypothetical protein